MVSSLLLEKERYIPVSSRAEPILYYSTKKSIEDLVGKQLSKVLLYKISSVYKLSEKELLTNYDLLEKSLYKTLGKTADGIIRKVRYKILRYAVLVVPGLTMRDIQNPYISVPGILDRIRKEEILRFVREMPSHEHVALFYKNENLKNEILSAYLDSTSITGTNNDHSSTFQNGVLSPRPQATTNNNNNNNNNYNNCDNTRNNSNYCFNAVSNGINNTNANVVLYGEFLCTNKQKSINESLHDWIQCLHSLNSDETAPVRIANEDATWWLRHCSPNQYVEFQKSLGRHIEDNMSATCAYNISRIDNEYLRTVMSAHNYIIFDQPFVIYKNMNYGQ
jgi:hypothetical protein